MPPTPTPSAPSSPTYKRRRTQNDDLCSSPAATLERAVRIALAEETSPRARNNRMNQVYDIYRRRAMLNVRSRRFDLFNDEDEDDEHDEQPINNNSNNTDHPLNNHSTQNHHQQLQQPSQTQSSSEHQQSQPTQPIHQQVPEIEIHSVTQQQQQMRTETEHNLSTNNVDSNSNDSNDANTTENDSENDNNQINNNDNEKENIDGQNNTNVNETNNNNENTDNEQHDNNGNNTQPPSNETSCNTSTCNHEDHEHDHAHAHQHQHQGIASGIFPGKGVPEGCEHYKRSCWIKAACCAKYYPCRRCHDENETHEIDRHATEVVACIKCGEKDQKVAKNCIKCGIVFARYFCSICKFYDDREGHEAYHCEDCGICRVGKGIGIDNYHCKLCGNCIPIHDKDTHPCSERSLDSNCPICTEHMATSTTQVMFLRCGHSMHIDCLNNHSQTSFTCPICHKSFTDMTDWYRDLDKKLEEEIMPSEYTNRISRVFCYDCEIKSDVPFHFIHHKCDDCHGYNTVVLEQFDKPNTTSTTTTTTTTNNIGTSHNSNTTLQETSFLQVMAPDTTAN